MGKSLIIISGPTAVGKTDISIELAQKFNSPVISADSRQIYREMTIGTAKPSAEQLRQVKHYFIGTKSITEYYNASKYEFEVLDLLEELFREKDSLIMAGGSGMYIDAVCYGIDDIPEIDMKVRSNLIRRLENEGPESLRFELKRLDPETWANIDLKNHQRILRALEVTMMTGKPYSSFLTKKNKQRDFRIIKTALHRDREELHQRINKRVDIMMQEGLAEEVKTLYPHKNLTALKTVGYRELIDYLDKKHTLDEAVELIKRNTRRYARRQISWFNRDKNTRWFHAEDTEGITGYITLKKRL